MFNLEENQLILEICNGNLTIKISPELYKSLSWNNKNEKCIASIVDVVEDKYKSYGNLDRFIENMSNDLFGCIKIYISNLCLEAFKNFKIFEYDEEIFITQLFQYNPEWLKDMMDAIASIENKYTAIAYDEEQQKRYRDASWAGRSKWVGGGFGMKGAIKGAVNAGLLNLAMDSVRTPMSLIGKGLDGLNISQQKARLYNDPTTIKTLTKSAIKALRNVYMFFLTILESERNIKILQSDFLYANRKKASVIFNNINTATSLSQEEYIEQFAKAINFDPTNYTFYEKLVHLIKDNKQDLEKTINFISTIKDLDAELEEHFDEILIEAYKAEIESIKNLNLPVEEAAGQLEKLIKSYNIPLKFAYEIEKEIFGYSITEEEKKKKDIAEAKKKTEEGLNLYKTQEYEKAIEYFDYALSLDPDSKDALVAKGHALYGFNNYEQAVECYNKILNVDPNNKEVLINKGHALQKLNKLDKETINCYEKALELDPNNKEIVEIIASSTKSLADSHENTGKYDEALNYYDKELEKDQENHVLLNKKGILLCKKESFKEAIVYFDKALEKKPGDGVILKNKEYALIAIKNLPKHHFWSNIACLGCLSMLFFILIPILSFMGISIFSLKLNLYAGIGGIVITIGGIVISFIVLAIGANISGNAFPQKELYQGHAAGSEINDTSTVNASDCTNLLPKASQDEPIQTDKLKYPEITGVMAVSTDNLDSSSPHLVIFDNDGNGKKVNLQVEKTIIGRSAIESKGIDINLTNFDPEKSISRKHAVIYAKSPGEYYLEDTGSSNGTRLNKEEIEKNKPFLLNEGDEIIFGNTKTFFNKGDS